MTVEIARADVSDKTAITELLDQYLRGLSAYREKPVGATNAEEYPCLDAYWQEDGRHAFLIRWGNDTVGFALIRDPRSTGSSVFQLAEFYVKPEARRRGIGRSAALAILKQFPGEWELQVHARNTVANSFWESCAAAVATKGVRRATLMAADGKRTRIRFRV